MQYSTDDKATWTRAATNQAGTSYTLSSADSTKTYIIGVRAVNDAGESDWTDSAAVSPPTVQTPPAVSSVSAVHNGGSVSASWSAVDSATGYDVQYSTDNKASWTRAATNQAGTSFTLSNADGTKTYIIGVRAVNDAGESDWTDSAAASPPAVQPPAAPGSVSAGRLGSDVVANWIAVDGATGYDVVYSTDNKTSWKRAATNHGANTYTLKDAEYSLPYIIGVRAVNSNGESGWTDSNTVPIVKPPSNVSNLVAGRGNGSIKVSWDAVSGATKYHVTYSTDGGASWSLAASEHTTNIIVIANTDAAKSYIVGVRAGNAAGWSGWTNSDTVPAN